MAEPAVVAGDRYIYGVSLKPVNVFIDGAAEVVKAPFILVHPIVAASFLMLGITTLLGSGANAWD